MSYESLTFVTGNEKKAAQLQRYLDVPIAHATLDIPELQSLDLTEVATDKAARAYALVQTPVLVEDAALSITNLKRLPGPFIKLFLAELGAQGVCDLLPDGADRSATTAVCYAIADGTQVRTFYRELAGSVATAPRGENGFGWDSIFIPDGYEQTRAEMGQADLDATAIRRKLLDEVADFLSGS